MPFKQPIVVGVTGKNENTDALRFAAREAELRACGVVLAHVVPYALPLAPTGFPLSDTPLLATGSRLVEEVRAEFEAIAGSGHELITEVRQGRPGDVLADLSKDAALVVVQHRDLSRLHHIVSGSTSAAVASRSHCPVVSVPPRRAVDDRGMVSVGVHEDGGPRAVLEAAFSEASRRGHRLRVTHAWRLAPAYDAMFPDDRSWSVQLGKTIHRAVHDLEAKFPDVAVAVDVRHEYPADSLVSASEESGLLVVGRHRHGRGQPHRLGSLTRTVLAHGACPVMVVPV